jgi:hypothetical protein
VGKTHPDHLLELDNYKIELILQLLVVINKVCTLLGFIIIFTFVRYYFSNSNVLDISDRFYKELSSQCCDAQVSVDLFSFCNEYVDITSFGFFFIVSGNYMCHLFIQDHYVNSVQEMYIHILTFS